MKLEHARSFSDLLVYQKTKAVSKAVFLLSKKYPKEETYSLTDQIRRSARSIGAQIAEAWAKRRYEKHFISKLTDSDGEQMETQHWVSESLDCGYISIQEAQNLTVALLEVGRMLNGMIEKADAFCGQDPDMLKEDAVPYFTSAD
jgi:four helix bundle protein